MGLPSIGPLELIIILAIALLVVGPGRLPEMGSAIGRTIREFRHASSDMADAVKVDSQPAATAPAEPNTLREAASPNVAAEPAVAALTAEPASTETAPVDAPAAAEPAAEASKADPADQA